MAMFDAGIFIILLATGFISIFISMKLGAIFKLVGAIIFFTVGTIMLGGYDVAFAKSSTSTDANNPMTINETIFIVGNGAGDPNHMSQIIGWIFIIIGIVAAFMFFMEILKV